MNTKVIGKDLTEESPRSPRIRVGGYAILGRTLDKCRALVAGNIGEYHFDCPLDNTLFGFKGVKGDDFKAQIENEERVIERTIEMIFTNISGHEGAALIERSPKNCV